MSRKRPHQRFLGKKFDIQGLIEFTNLLTHGKDEILSWISEDTGKLNTIKFTQMDYVKADERNTNSHLPDAHKNGRAFEADSNQYVKIRGSGDKPIRIYTPNNGAICT